MQFKISAVVTAHASFEAAGSSGLFFPVPDRPAVRRCVESLLEAKVSEVIVTVDETVRDRVVEALAGLSVRVIAADGSLRAGLRDIDPASTAVIVFPADHPLVCPTTIEDLLEEHPFCRDNILVLLFDGKQGQPSLFPRKVMEEVLSGLSLPEVISRYSGTIRYLVTDDDGTVLATGEAEARERLRQILLSDKK
ncbi:MAG: NTP transferase domain-containing protein [Nitrospirota bacterium]|nr:NTP transferase domain-containing protein [Nitrospirota bacterium]